MDIVSVKVIAAAYELPPCRRKTPIQRQTFFIYLTRILLVLFTLLLAELIPKLALFISLVGAFSGAALSLIYPAIIDLLIHYSANTLTWRVKTRDMLILVVGCGGLLSGTFASLRDIVEEFGTPDDI